MPYSWIFEFPGRDETNFKKRSVLDSGLGGCVSPESFLEYGQHLKGEESIGELLGIDCWIVVPKSMIGGIGKAISVCLIPVYK